MGLCLTNPTVLKYRFCRFYLFLAMVNGLYSTTKRNEFNWKENPYP